MTSHLLKTTLLFTVIAIAILCTKIGTATEKTTTTQSKAVPEKVRTQLTKLSLLMGEWRGVGQVKRGSRKGMWSQKAAWAWEFGDNPGLRHSVKKGKFFETALLTYDIPKKAYRLDEKIDEKNTRTYYGQLKDKKLQLTSKPDAQGIARQVTITLLNQKRVLILHEKKLADRNRFDRLAEIGYTRAGTRLATPGANTVQCIVTGGAATIPVKYKGKTYYVCCSGCKQAFEEEPEKILAEYKARIKKEKMK